MQLAGCLVRLAPTGSLKKAEFYYFYLHIYIFIFLKLFCDRLASILRMIVLLEVEVIVALVQDFNLLTLHVLSNLWVTKTSKTTICPLWSCVTSAAAATFIYTLRVHVPGDLKLICLLFKTYIIKSTPNTFMG